MEYLLLISGALLVGIIIFVLANQAVGEGKNILETNLGLSMNITQTSTDNVFIPLTTLSFEAMGGDGTILLSYSAPGASSFLLVVEGDPIGDGPNVVDTLDEAAFDGPIAGAQKFALPFYEQQAEYGGAVNGVTYYFRLRACDDAGTCIVSGVEEATAGFPSS